MALDPLGQYEGQHNGEAKMRRPHIQYQEQNQLSLRPPNDIDRQSFTRVCEPRNTDTIRKSDNLIHVDNKCSPHTHRCCRYQQTSLQIPSKSQVKKRQTVTSECVRTSSAEARFNSAANVEKLPEPGCERRNGCQKRTGSTEHHPS